MSSFSDCPLYLASYGHLETVKPPSAYDSHAYVTLSLSHPWRDQHMVLLHAHCERLLWTTRLAPSYEAFLESYLVVVQFVAQYQGVSGLHYGQHPDDPETVLHVHARLLSVPSVSINDERQAPLLLTAESLNAELASLKTFLP